MPEDGPAVQHEFAPAKINLSLEIRGRRADGYHEIESLIAFADAGDTLGFQRGDSREIRLRSQGPYAGAIDGDNLVLEAARAFLACEPEARGGDFRLDKQLPVAGGIGGGSSDAAAAIRLLARANSCSSGWRERLMPDLARLGADIPVCLGAQAAWVRGLGEKLAPMDRFPPLHGVLVNPGVLLPTRDVFAALDAPALDNPPEDPPGPTAFSTAASLIDFLGAHPNDLEPPARKLAPAIGEVLEAVRKTSGCRLARLSGSGPTCYGLFACEGDAALAAQDLARAHPSWWVMQTRLS